MRRQILTSATALDGTTVDVLIGETGAIEAIGPDLAPPEPLAGDAPGAIDRVDLSGHVLLPAATEPHAHLDKAFLAEVVENPTGDLIGAIDAMRANRHRLTLEETIERGERAARLMATNGYTAVRTHADTTVEQGLTSIEALVEIRDRVADVIDVEIVALCGWPVTGTPGADQRALLRAALAGGADLVGGCPHLETFDGDGSIASATEVLLEIATDFDRPVDLHTDETLDPDADGLARLAAQVAAGFTLPVTASHCVSLGQQSVADQRRTAEAVAAAGISVIALPHTNLFLQGRGCSPMPRALTAVQELRDAGANVAAGADNLQDPFNPLGRACPFETAGLMVLAAHLRPSDAWAMVSTNSARALDRTAAAPDAGGHGLRPGAPADLVAVPAANIREAIAMSPRDRLVWRTGRRMFGET